MLRIYFQYYRDRSPVRQAEIEACLKANLANPHIDQCVAVVDSCTELPEHPRLLYANLDDLGAKHPSGRPTFAQVVALAGSMSAPEDVHAIANSDIEFTETAELLRAIPANEWYSLGRWDVLADGSVRMWNVNCGQDVWVWRGTARRMAIDFPFGFPGCDNRLAAEAQRAGYVVRNPAKSIRVLHRHASAVRHWPATEARLASCSGRVPPPYLNVFPATLDETPRYSVRANETVSTCAAAVKTRLESVTLLCVDCVNPAAAAKAMAYSLRGLDFGAAILLTDGQAPAVSGVARVRIPKLESVDAYNRFMLDEAHKYVPTAHCLSVQADGFLLHADRWIDEFLDYDYVGAPWPPNHTWAAPHFVGNSGFCLRSKRLMEATAGVLDTPTCQGFLDKWQRPIDDIATCTVARPWLENLGMRFAPVDVAWRFARELPLPERAWGLTDCLGFHGRLTPQTTAQCDRLAAMSLEEAAGGSGVAGGLAWEDEFPAEDPIFYHATVQAGEDLAGALRVAVVAAAHNSGEWIVRSLDMLEAIGRQFLVGTVVMADIDSTDGSREVIEDWARQAPSRRACLQCSGSPAEPLNACRREVAQRGPFDAVLVLDPSIQQWSRQGLMHAIGHWGAYDLMAACGIRRERRNQYHDVWSVRYKRWQADRDPCLPPLHRGAALVPVLSAFGGLAIYRAEAYLAGQYQNGENVHVEFHRTLHAAGFKRAFVDPSLIVLYG